MLDTVRADAVSASGHVTGTTPAFDGLAANGRLYTRAYAEAPWTVPSHASLFSGLGVADRGIGAARRVVLPDRIETLAERLDAAGYETMGVSENPLVSEPFGLAQGFSRFAVRSQRDVIAETHAPDAPGFVIATVERFLRERDPDRPTFLFVNLMEAHEPYTVREHNPFLPEGVDAAAAAAVRQSTARICDAIPPDPELAILRGLYLGDVAAADRTLGSILERVRSADFGGEVITIVTSDHGEHLGEHRLLDHQFSLHDVLLHVPLVVDGAPDSAPARIDTPVSLLDIVPSILTWADLPATPDLTGRALPAADQSADPGRGFLAVYGDAKPSDWPADVRVYAGEKRRHCSAEDGVFGDQAAITRHTEKLVWSPDRPSRLYDLSWDTGERSDLAGQQPARLQRLEAELRERLAVARPFDVAPDDPPPSADAIERLRSLGYIE